MRLIDADTLIEKCGEWYTEEGSEEGFIGTMKQLLDKQPTIEPKQAEWIPVSERLPNADDCPMDCMVTRRSKYVGNYTERMRKAR